MRTMLFLLLAPVIVYNNDAACDHPKTINEQATCRNVCEAKLKKTVHYAEAQGTSGMTKQRVCTCYLDRVVVVDDSQSPTAEKVP